MAVLADLKPMATIDPVKTARLHEQLNDWVYDWPGGPVEQWQSHASWHDRGQTVVSFDGLLFDAWASLELN